MGFDETRAQRGAKAGANSTWWKPKERSANLVRAHLSNLFEIGCVGRYPATEKPISVERKPCAA